MSRQLHTIDGRAVCNVVSWPPRQDDAGCWELAVRGDPSIFDLLSDYQGCDFKVGEHTFCRLTFIRREIVPPRDEMECPTMVFVGVEGPETNVGECHIMGSIHNG